MTWTQRWDTSMMRNYGRPPLLLVRGEGARVWDDEGSEYIDLLAGIAVNSLGHGHPTLVAAVTEQLSTLGHTSNLYATEPGLRLAERLLELSDAPAGSRVFFCNSGAEANEAAFKLTRLTGRTKVVVAALGFHGRTMGALALTAQPAKQDPFRPLPGEVVVVPFGDAEALANAVDSATAAVVLEPILGESGVIVPPDGYLAAARAACDRAGALLVLDEVQTGIGRTGTWFAFQESGIRPDVMTLAKGLAGGLPIGALVAFGRAADLFTPGSHGSTFGGNPVSAGAALAVIEVIEREGLLARVAEVSDLLRAGIPEASQGLVQQVRGRGLLLAAELEGVSSADLHASLTAHGLLTNAVTPDAIRLAPPLVLTDDDVAEVLVRWARACEAVAARA
ncbi:MAG: acetylornithine transaminase [Candidatus Nanopelagicales bacterium]|nr:acetylornithine transaminase [Candidatus Nanopelagicales bacterium]